MSGDPLHRPPSSSARPQSPRAIQFVDDLVDTAGPLQDPLSPNPTTVPAGKLPFRHHSGSSPATHTPSVDFAGSRSGNTLNSRSHSHDESSDGNDERGDQDQGHATMPTHTNYGSTGHLGSASVDASQTPSDTPTRQPLRAAGPGKILLPPSPYTPAAGQANAAEADENHDVVGSVHPFRSRASSISPSIATSTSNNRLASQRQMSFKRRAPASTTSQRVNLLQRASMGVFPSSRKLSLAGSDAASNWRRIRRVHTTSVHPAGDGDGDDPEGDDSVWNGDGLPSIPRLLPSSKPDPYSTPIPTLPFVVLCLVVFGEFSSSGVAGPFLFFMIEDFGVGGESDVGFWAGIVSAAFFFAQFLTSLMWASVAEKRGRRFVLMVSLIGNASSLVFFGTSKNLTTAILIRMAQGFFNGAVGVAKGAIRDITDETNEGRAYAQMGFFWGMGGIVGPILGGLLEHPVKKYPSLFGDSELFTEYPYLLPCMAAAFFTALGAFFSLFIGYDGGPRTGKIQLPEKADIERATSQMASNMGSLGRTASKRLSGYFGGGRADSESLLSLSRTNTRQGQQSEGPSTPSGQGKSFARTFTQQVDDETGGPPSPVESEGTIVTRAHGNDSGFSRLESRDRPRLFSRTEERQRNVLGGGSAYGYDRHMSRSSGTQVGAGHRPSTSKPRQESVGYERHARPSFSSQNEYAPDFEDIGGRPGLNFAQRFLLAQDDSVFTISDLWVAAAINGEDAYEDVFEDDDEDEDLDTMDDDDEEGDVFDEEGGSSSIAGGSFNAAEDSIDEEDEEGPTEGSPLLAPRHLPPLNFAQRKLSRAGALSDAGRSASSSRRRASRRISNAGRVPSLYVNTGIESPLLSPGMQQLNPFSPTSSTVGPFGSGAAVNSRTEGGWDPTLAGIPESQSNRNSLAPGSAMIRQNSGAGVSPDRRSMAQPSVAGKASLAAAQPSLFTLLPTVIIAHYGLMAFHSSTFDQVFMAFLVTPEPSGGLGLTAAHFAQLIAAMACCQLVFQFVFYPKVGPPQGKLSHLAMLRLGTSIYLPCYTLFPLLRGLLHPETDGYVMAGMIFFASLRWLANVCAFTAVSVLINAMTPPHLTPLANGLAQTTSSAARFVGPIIGGLVWAKGIEGGPDAHAWPFNYHLGFWFVGLAAFTGFLFSWRIK